MNAYKNFQNIRTVKSQNWIFKKLETPENHQVSETTGFVNVGVFTASGALPVPDAVVTVYDIHEDGTEHAFYHLVTDRSGNVPRMELPVFHKGREFDFTEYNLRVQAIDYYTVNVLDVRVFPGVSTNYRINLIPAAQGTEEEQSQTVIIPSIPLDATN